ncbi:MAG TPA: glucosyl-3-phosphoglycerate synthase [Termitinemataceae bacterium]|nr:glucosyl-3-phosphoglycerate synthase [Termitinemataceae bacterium]HOM23423.1 glucosyl-3-phosphoglycerate synthase [Termitinemataceae bacterium]HPQ01339.1 glucosyl-3-phosphoglycerate synthase [Termitinemataceae bacterium]
MELQGNLLERTWHHSRFQDVAHLVALKQKKGLSISLAFPTLNEEATIGKEILVIKTELMDRYPLLDEIVVIDSSSQDKTREIAKRFGAQVYESKEILTSYGSYKGKGENLWKSLYVLKGDIIVWVDADISNISPKFVYALVGPLLEYDTVGYVKAFYERPMQSARGIMPSGGGRVTEILVRPLFSLYYPELAYFIQPLSGEYAGRRTVLERLSFSVGYGVELGHLLDLYHEYGMGIFAQVDLDIRVHRNQSTEALGKMAYGILRTFFNRAQRYGEAQILRDLHPYHLTLQVEGDQHRIQRHDIPATERPPMIEIPEYQNRFKKESNP